jgi:hypothetical protein
MPPWLSSGYTCGQYRNLERLLVLTLFLIELIHMPRQVINAPQENLIRDFTLVLSTSAD